MSYSKSIGTPIVDEKTGDLLGLVENIIIHPETGKIEAFWVKPAYLPVENAVLSTDSILKWGQKIYIKDRDEIALPEDIIRISNVLSQNILFIENTVKNQNSEFIGKVYDLDFDTQRWRLKNIYTAKKWLWIKIDKRIFSYESIVQVFTDHILVKDKQEAKLEEGIDLKINEPVA